VVPHGHGKQQLSALALGAQAPFAGIVAWGRAASGGERDVHVRVTPQRLLGSRTQYRHAKGGL